MMNTADTLSSAESLARVREEVAAAYADAKRDPASVTLIAVSKTFAAESVKPVIAAGQRVFGENRVQEAKAKWPALRAAHPGLELHLIGPLQSNKAKEAVALFDAIHSVDRPNIAEALAKEITRQGKRPLLFVEINTGAEPQKAGVLPEDADAFIKTWRQKPGLDRDERRFCDRHRFRRDACAGWNGDFWGACRACHPTKEKPRRGAGGLSASGLCMCAGLLSRRTDEPSA